MKKKCNRVPAPYNKWITLTGWKKFFVEDRKSLLDLVKSQKIIGKYYKNRPPEEYVNMNAQIEYDRHMGLR
jgi:hypothetical protein